MPVGLIINYKDNPCHHVSPISCIPRLSYLGFKDGNVSGLELTLEREFALRHRKKTGRGRQLNP
uniref:Uncharacterized protein n=1 Tax=Strigamia maritima TaxID=126957 RepID=T1IPM3_STRMM